MGRLGRFFRYKVFVDALFHSEVMSIFNLPIDNQYFTLSLVKTFIADVLKCKAHLKTKFKYACLPMCSSFSCDLIKMKIDQLKYQQCFSLLTSVQYFTQRLVFR